MKKITIILLCLLSYPLLSKNNEYYIVTPKGLNLRSSSDQKSKVMILIPFNAKVVQISEIEKADFIDGCGAKWINVDYNGYKGWVYDMYLSNNKPIHVNKDNINFIKQLHSSFNSTIIKYKNYDLKFGSDDVDIIKLLGKPNKIYNLEWGGYFEYNDFLIGFNDYLSDDYEKMKKEKGFKYTFCTIQIGNKKYSFEEIITSIGMPSKLYVNCQDGMWYCQYENKFNIINYVFKDLNVKNGCVEIINKRK